MGEETKSVTFHAPVDLMDWVEEEAEKNDRSVSAQLRIIIDNAYRTSEGD